ncbi:hypothetical protein Q4555_09275 [Octadecabacter sp. 1_MG-2023]|uniref:hypothetical protein n=1 Tax=unclassified Octadecabacter TaxID=196158 RepID=UPI001C0A283A|nr:MULTISPECIES: hypothetical protein [unclassified Octadecabacter]MBU2992381.1 hypothetical protein [Octadecabacter sp. B2R22]MDO6734862.1 hypothetical protein [Octadecabacter sp. 1_MG-2023]
MTGKLTSFRRLIPVLDMAFQAEQLKMAQVLSHIEGLAKQLAELERPQSVDPLSLASRTGADVLWETWAKDKKVLINQELARAFRDREILRERLVKTLSKLEAAKQMEQRAVLEERQLALRRSSW